MHTTKQVSRVGIHLRIDVNTVDPENGFSKFYAC